MELTLNVVWFIDTKYMLYGNQWDTIVLHQGDGNDREADCGSGPTKRGRHIRFLNYFMYRTRHVSKTISLCPLDAKMLFCLSKLVNTWSLGLERLLTRRNTILDYWRHACCFQNPRDGPCELAITPALPINQFSICGEFFRFSCLPPPSS